MDGAREMIVAELKIREGDNGRYLTGKTRYELPENTILVLKKHSDTEWNLVAIEKRRIDTSPENLYAFIPPDAETQP